MTLQTPQTAIRKVPSINLLDFVHGTSADRVKFVDQLMYGLKEYGFIVLSGHLVERSVIDASYESIAAFFSLAEETKKQFICHEGGGQRGYTPFGTEHAKNNPAPDLKEFWHVGREVPQGHAFKKFYPDNLWPDQYLPSFRTHLTKLYQQLDATSFALMDAVGLGLDLPQEYFRNMITEGNSILRPIHYPALGPNAPKNAVRSAAHEDINLITILVGATASGLQLLDRNNQWLEVVHAEGELVVDSGDMLSRITNEVIPSTTHRVINPPDQTSNRYSMPFFVHPNPETVLECIPSCLGQGAKFEPINSHQFLMQRLKEIGLLDKKPKI